MKVLPQINMSEDAALVYPLLHDAETMVISGKNYYHYCMRENSVCGGTKNDANGVSALKQHFHGLLEQGRWCNPLKKMQYDISVAYAMALANPSSFFWKEDRAFLPYENVTEEQQIVLYGAGKFGKQLKEYIDRDGKYSVVAWTDKTVKEGCIPVEEALISEYDVILIMIASAAPAEAVYNELIEKGVSKDKIRKISIKKIIDELL